MSETHLRSLTKSVSWRIIGTLQLIILTYLFTGALAISISVGLIDVFLNLTLYYLHERVWDFSDWGRAYLNPLRDDRRVRSIAKSLTWRLTATLYLIIILIFFTEQAALSVSLALTDALLNILFYYLHERIWNQVSWGKKIIKV